jgi:phospholipid/cholesterol/gamma-HCH transport system substrate-binding protein
LDIAPDESRISPRWWPLIFLVVMVLTTWVVANLFTGSFHRYKSVMLTSDRSGLVMETGAKVKLSGVQVGRVGDITSVGDSVRMKLDIEPAQLKNIPANVEARIAATTVFGAKYVDLIYPADPSPKSVVAGATLRSQNVSTEVNTVFENLVGVVRQIDSAKLDAVLSALAEGVRGQGENMGRAITATDQVLEAVNARTDTIAGDWRTFRNLSGTYASAAPDIVSTLDALATTSTTLTTHAKDVDALLLELSGFARAGDNLVGPNQQNLAHSIEALQSTTNLLFKYNPSLTCTLVGSQVLIDDYDLPGYMGGRDGATLIVDVALLLGDEIYRYPDNLPIIAAKGGPGGKPGCGSLPDVKNNFPVRHLVTNTGWGTGLDLRPNPGIGQFCYADWFRVTRAVPLPPAVRQCLPGPAVGPQPKYGPETPPYGAPMYGPDGVPLFPHVPPAPEPAPPADPAPAPPPPP